MLIALLTACSYLAAMSYELAYFRYFQAPIFFISPTPYVMLGSLVGVGTLLVLYIPLVSALVFVLRVVPGEEMKSRVAIGVVAWSCVWLVFGSGYFSALAAAGIGCWWILFLIRMARQANGPWKQRFLAGLRAPLDTTQSAFMSSFERRFGIAPFLIFSLIYLSFTIAYVSGHAMARFQTTFHVSASHQNTILLRGYGDYLLGMQIDPQSRQLTGRYSAIKMSETEPLQIVRKKIGLLAPPD
jgi:hypothetical protein